MKKIDISGMRFGDWVVIGFSKTHNNNSYWFCKCLLCGEVYEVQRNSLVNGKSTCCRACSSNKLWEDITGNIYGEFKVISYDKIDRGNEYWLCECSCGKIKSVFKGNLIRGKSTNCGHKKEDLTGKRFGRRTVKSFFGIGKNRTALWNCVCECGGEGLVSSSLLKSGQSKSCGCYRKEKTSGIYVGRKTYGKYSWYFLDEFDNKIPCRSSYEVFVWNYHYHQLKLNIQYETKSFITSSGKYTPDFYIPEHDVWLEIKGSFDIDEKTKKQKKKILEVSNNNKLVVLFWKDIVDICGLKYKQSQSYFRNADKAGCEVEYYLANMLYMEK